MKRFLLSIVVLLSLCLPSFGGAKAVITGPKEVPVGDLIILDAAQSEGLKYKWVLVGSKKTFYEADKGLKLLFACGTPGDYTFVLVVGGEDNNKNMVVDMAEHTITIKGSGPIIPPIIPPVVPVVIPDGEFKVSKSVYDWAKTTNDKVSALKVSANFESISAQISARIITSPEVVIQMTASTNKNAVSNYEVWRTNFFAPLNTVLNNLSESEKLTTMEQHATCWREIGLGVKLYAEEK